MFSLLVYVLLAVVVGGGLFLIAVRFLPAGEQIAPAVRDEQPWELPATRSLYADDIDTVRLPVALRGYRFAETDVLLDRLADALRERDTEIARLTRVVRPQPDQDATEGGQLVDGQLDYQPSRPPPEASSRDGERTTPEEQ